MDENVNNNIAEWAKSLTERLIEIRYFNKQEMGVAINAHIKTALYDCLKIQLPNTYKALNEAKLNYAAKKGNNKSLQAEIVYLKQKLKEENKLYAELDRQNQAKELVLWMRKYHNESIEEFYKMYDIFYPKPSTQTFTQNK